MSVINPRSGPASSPCIGRCTLTTGDLVCKGCGRTEVEFRDWNTYSDEQKIRVKALAATRLNQ